MRSIESTRRPRLLAIDDEPEICRFIETVAKRCGYEVRTLSAPRAFMETYREWRPDAIVLDIAMPEIDGVELLTFLSDEGSDSRILLISGFGGGMIDVVARLGSAYSLDIAAALPKPVRAAELMASLESARCRLPDWQTPSRRAVTNAGQRDDRPSPTNHRHSGTFTPTASVRAKARFIAQ